VREGRRCEFLFIGNLLEGEWDLKFGGMKKYIFVVKFGDSRNGGVG
jgi:hypothetical protein